LAAFPAKQHFAFDLLGAADGLAAMGAEGQHEFSLPRQAARGFGFNITTSEVFRLRKFLENRMPIILGVDLGTTKITALTLETGRGDVLACATAPNQAEITSPADKARGYSEWNARRIVKIACESLRQVAVQLAGKEKDLPGIGITGQQHGGARVDDGLMPLTPLINWQDRRGEETIPGTGQTYVERAVQRVGAEAPRRAGCK